MAFFTRAWHSHTAQSGACPPARIPSPSKPVYASHEYIPKKQEHSSRAHIRKKRRVVLWANSTAKDAPTAEEAKAFTAMYERETPLLGSILEELQIAGFNPTKEPEGQSGSGELADDMKEILKTVVDKFYKDMSQGFIMVLAGYAQAAYSQRANDLGATVEMIREEVLNISMNQLPQEMQVLDELITRIKEPKKSRLDLITAMSEQAAPSGGLPASLGSLRSTATQMLEDMEVQEDIIDRRLVARLCLAREDIDEAAKLLHQTHPGSEYYDMMTTSFRLLPMGNAAFVKEIIGVPLAEKRQALLEVCLKDDFQNTDSQLMKRWRQQGVRSGRLMNTIKALLVALKDRNIPETSPESMRLLNIQAVATDILKGLID